MFGPCRDIITCTSRLHPIVMYILWRKGEVEGERLCSFIIQDGFLKSRLIVHGEEL